MVVSSVASELILAGAAVIAAVAVLRARPGPAALPAGVGLALLGVAALLGSVRYAGLDAIIPAHTVVSRLAAAGLAAVGVAWCGVAFRHGAWRWVGWGLLGLAIPLALFWTDGPWRLPLGVAGVLLGVIGAAAWLRPQPVPALLGIVGALGVAGAGLAFDTSAMLLGWPQLDWFHVSLTAAVALYTIGLVRAGG